MTMNILSDYALSANGGLNRENSKLLPRNIRGLLIGKSGCGKTTVLMNLLLRDHWLDYTRLYVFGQSLHQPEYQTLQAGFLKRLDKEQISNVFKYQATWTTASASLSPVALINAYDGVCRGNIKAAFYTDCTQIPDPTTLDVNEKNLLVLDDCMQAKQSKAEAYYTRGRHNNCDTLYISQNYFALPRQTIRENSNFIILFPQDSKNLTHLYLDHCSDDMTRAEFMQFCRGVWREKEHNFVTLDLTSTPLNGKYRKNLDDFYFPPSCFRGSI